MLLKILLCVLVVQIKKIKHTRTHTKFEAGHLTAPNLSSLTPSQQFSIPLEQLQVYENEDVKSNILGFLSLDEIHFY